MKKYAKLMVVLACMVGALIASTVALASTSYTKSVQGTVTILAPAPGLGVFMDVGCTIPVTEPIAWGTGYPGDTLPLQTFYVKNVGQIAFASVTSGVLTGGSMTATVTPNLFPLPVGAVQREDIQIILSPTATPGSYSGRTLDFITSY